MKPLLSTSSLIALEWAAVGFWIFVLLFSLGLKHHSPRWLRRALWLPGSILKLLLIFVTVGLLAGCASSDPLPIAHGPLFPLNAGHWQPMPQDLNAPPKIAEN